MRLRLSTLAAAGLILAYSTGGPAQEVGPHQGVLATIATDRTFRIGAFRHMDRIFPDRVIRRSGPVFELAHAERPLEVNYEWNGGKRSLADFIRRTSTTSLLIIKDGKIVSENYYLGADEHSTFTSMSVAKSFTSTLVGLAIADGKIESIDRPVTDYLPELKGSGYDGVPIKAILQMSSGVNFSEDYGGTDDLSLMWQRCMEQNMQSLDDYAKSLTRKEPPGERFYYRSVDTQVLGWLVNRVTGEHPADYLSRKVWQPLGMESDATWLTDATGMEAAFCCIGATARDYARFGLLFMNKGRVNDRQILPEKWITQATVPGSPQVQPGKLIKGNPLGYQYQWWAFPGSDHAFSAEGVFFQFVYVNPVEKVVIVKSSAFDTFWDDKVELETYAAFHAIEAALKSN
jgi:CubicO group peptidase (beta-lactamase class C family)